MDWSMLDTVEKFLVVGGMVSLILAAAAPGKIPYFEVEWSANNRRALAAVGILLLVLSYPPLRNFK